MSQAATRLGDKSAGHFPGFPPTPSVAGSPTVFINSKPAIRVGDAYETHLLPFPPIIPHDSVSAQGSKTVFCEGLALTRVGDDMSCSDKVAEGSPNVFVG